MGFMVKMGKDEIKNFPTQWNKNQKVILMGLFLLGKTFQEIADELNNYLKKVAKEYDTFPHRSERAVAYQCYNLKLLSKEDFEEWDKKRSQLIMKDRFKGLFQLKKKVLERDGNKCVICNSNQNLHFAHTIPFIQTRLNIEIESITLCGKHHKKFDDGDSKVIGSVFKQMSKYYGYYEEQYSLIRTSCSVHGEHVHIKRGKNETKLA